MRDLLLIALYAALGAAAVGLAGLLALRALRRRSVAVSLAVLTAVAVGSVLAGTLSVAWAMLLNKHDLGVITTVCVMAGVTATASALLLGRWVIGGHRAQELAERARAFRDRQAPDPEWAALSWEQLKAIARDEVDR